MSTLSVTALSKKFNNIETLSGLSFTVEDGEFFAMLGPSASGKTTAPRAVIGRAKVELRRRRGGGTAGSRWRDAMPRDVGSGRVYNK